MQSELLDVGKPRRAVRRERDFYETPPWMTRALVKYVDIQGSIFEPCVGDHSILNALPSFIGTRYANDINPDCLADFHGDAASDAVWQQLSERTGSLGVDWVITNPPFTSPLPMEILKRARMFARVGVALMLRISWLEPTKNEKKHPRGPWLSAHPPDKYLVMPRHSFTGNGQSDNATTAWMIWTRERLPGRPIECCYGAEQW